MVKLEYPELFHDDLVWHGRAEDLARRTHELSDFLVNVLGVDDVGARFEGKATYHMACHLRGLGLMTEPERLLEKSARVWYLCRWNDTMNAAASAARSRSAIPASAARWSPTRLRSSKRPAPTSW